MISAALSAALLVASTAFAEPTNAGAPGKPHGSDEGRKGGAGARTDDKDKKADDKDKKADDKDKKADDKDKKADDKDKKADDKGKSGSDRAARIAKQHEDQKAKLQSTLKGPMDASVKEELRRHAERVARIERIKAVATDAKDNDAVERSAKLVGKENARHDKWLEKHVGTAGTPAAVTPAAAVPAAATAPAPKGDVK
jgi:hypothetical protein